MQSHQQIIPKVLFLFFILFYTSIGFAQKKSTALPTAKHINGLDPFPVYKATQKNSFIDSIIYNGPFITFCVSFEKPTSDGHYLFEAVNSNHGWTCETAAGVCHPVLIKNIRKNGQLISDYVKISPLDLVFRDKEQPTTKISCEFQFWRKDFVNGEATLSETLIRDYNSKKTDFHQFKGIRIRTSKYPKPISKKYAEDFNWARNNLLQKINYTINEVPQKISTEVKVAISRPDDSIIPTYKVYKNSQNQLFLKGVWHTNTTTIFRVQYYVDPSSYSSINLHNKGSKKYYIKTSSKKFKMRSIKNILVNQFLLNEELKDKESLKLEKEPSLYLLTYDVHFDRLPDDLKTFDLIEGKNLEGTTPFNFYAVDLN